MIDPVALNIGGVQIRWYGICIALGVVAASWISACLAKKKGYNSDLIFDLLIYVLPLAIVGARLYYVIFEWGQYANDPISILYIWNGGLAIYGGIIGGALGVLIFCKIRRVSFMQIADFITPGLILAQGIGRWGNFFNQEAFGEKVLNESLQWFPYAVHIQRPGVINPETGVLYGEGWFQATFFYEFVWCLIGFAVLLYCYKKMKNRGNVAALYMVFYGLGRFFIEALRTDSLWLIPNVIKASQLLSVIIIIVGLLYIFIFSKKLKPFEYHGKYSAIESPQSVAEETETQPEEEK